MTPDVCQAWLMSRLSTPVVKEFVGSLLTIIIDEAHSLEAVFGSNFAFFIRRLEAARNYIAESKSAKQPLQYIGATATIAKPNEHMKLLTGHEFAVIDDNADGSPQHDRILAHVACPEGEELEIAKSIQNYILTTDSDRAFITFVDSRKAVEILALSAGAKMTSLGLQFLLTGRGSLLRTDVESRDSSEKAVCEALCQLRRLNLA